MIPRTVGEWLEYIRQHNHKGYIERPHNDPAFDYAMQIYQKERKRMTSKAKPMGFLFPEPRNVETYLRVRAGYKEEVIWFGSLGGGADTEAYCVSVKDIPDFCAALQELADTMTRIKEENEDECPQ